MQEHEKIDYVEFPASTLEKTKAFFSKAFGWSFQDYGPDYTAFTDAGLQGGFFRSDLQANTADGSALIVIYSSDLEGTHARIIDAGGTIIKNIFSFPGGRRFHFTEPSGNELAVWSDRAG